jgi:hypothetical protein
MLYTHPRNEINLFRAFFGSGNTPPSVGYLPPEDPLLGVSRQIMVSAQLKAAIPEMMMRSAYSCLQDWLANVAQAAVRQGDVDLVGVGWMVLAYPQFPADVLAGKPMQRNRICRTFSDCTTAPHKGFDTVSQNLIKSIHSVFASHS